jgi:23S rRNA (cytidine1920-2'-O)/16S rRNA (cytidine1409-2'-O)-methyltransferase
MKQPRQRIDLLLVERGLAESRERARALLLAGSVMVAGQRVDKAGAMVALDAAIEVLEKMPWVSRGAYKLIGALDLWSIDVTGRVCLDVGSSTGGFTDVLLARGAARVHCLDVGQGQLHWKLRNDPRVVHLAVCDVSFISVTLILPAFAPLLAPPREFVVLVKPQFEVGRDQVGKGGIVRDPALHAAAVERARSAAGMLGFETKVADSPITGAEGNKEFLLHGTDPHSRHHLEA